VVIPDSVVSIDGSSFEGCIALTSIDVGCGNPTYNSVDGVLFSKDRTALLKYPASKWDASYSVPDSVTTIVNGAFFGCHSLTDITIGNGVTYIGYVAFSGCTGLTSITIPNSVTFIDDDAFWNCVDLTSVICLAVIPPDINSDAFNGVTQLPAVLYVPKSAIAAYRGAAGWKNFINIEGYTGINGV